MKTIDQFLKEIQFIPWFEHKKVQVGEYYVISSVFEAYDIWNEQMLRTWQPQIILLEHTAIRQIGDAKIDEIFSVVSSEIEMILYQKWNDFMLKSHLAEVGLENEMLDMVKRDLCWACVERVLNVRGFFTKLLEIYQDGYFPCAWTDLYPNGQPVVL